MVSLVLSTVSVITSIFVVRINDATTPLPKSLRVIVFRYAARVLCVSVRRSPSSSTLSVVPDDSLCGRTSTSDSNVKLTDTVAAAAGSSQPVDHTASQAATQTDCCCHCQLKPQLNSVLCELRKVTSLLLSLYLHLIVKPPPPVGAGEGYMFSGRPSVRASVRPSVIHVVVLCFRDISSIC